MGVGRWGQGRPSLLLILKFASFATNFFWYMFFLSWFGIGKMKFHHCWRPLAKTVLVTPTSRKNSLSARPGKKSFRRPCFRGFVIRRYPQRTARLPEPSPGRTSTPAGKCIPLVRDTGNRLAGQRRTRCPRPWPGPGERGTCGPGPCIVPGRILCPRSGGTTGRFRCSALLCHKGRRESSGRARKNRARCREVTLELRTTDFF